MFTKLIIRNFKCLTDSAIELGKQVVFIGPNNSGKTSALQAIALWEAGLRTWLIKRGTEQKALKRSGVAINRKDLISISLPDIKLLWKDLHVRKSIVDSSESRRMENILIEIKIEGVTENKNWECGFEFDFANSESIYCRPLRIDKNGKTRLELPDEFILQKIKTAFLPPMSGLSSVEPKLELGRINVLIGEGQTAQVLRNLCLMVFETNQAQWSQIVEKIRQLFGVELMAPAHDIVRGELSLGYREKSGIELDISSAGRGLQQTLLLITYLFSNPGTVILLDEPDAHLEILRQREIYQLITDISLKQDCQIIAASHSEVILNEAAERDTVIAFVGKPHKLNDKGQQVLKSLKEIGFEDYYLAEQKGWVLYLEGSTDLSILQTLADKLEHPVLTYLAEPFVKYLGTNSPGNAERHYYALREANENIYGIAIFDRITNPLKSTDKFKLTQWSKREMENYICKKYVIIDFIKGEEKTDDLFLDKEISDRVKLMEECISELENALQITGKPSPWSDDLKVTDEFLDPLFRNYLMKLKLPLNTIRKSSYFELAKFLKKEDIDDEIIEKLDLIHSIAQLVAG